MKHEINFSDLSNKYAENSNRIKEIEKIGIDYGAIAESKKKQMELIEQEIFAIKPENIRDFEKESKPYMEKIMELEKEVSELETKAGEKEKLIKENKEILEKAKERKEELIQEVEEYYEKAVKELEKDCEKELKEQEKNKNGEVKKAKDELENYKKQLKQMEEQEEKYPNRVKDSKYKEFLNEKIKAKEEFLEQNSLEKYRNDFLQKLEEKKNDLLKEINEKYLTFKKDVAKEYMPEEAKKPNPVLEKAKQNRIKQQQGQQATQQGSKLPDDVKIRIGRTGTIIYDGVTFKIGKKEMKEGNNLSQDQIIDMLKDVGMNINPQNESFIKMAIKEKFIDTTVLNAISSVTLRREDKKNLMKTYILEAFDAKEKRKVNNLCNIEYDKKDLSKASIFARIFKREMNDKEKMQIFEKASKAVRYGLAKTEGTYKPNWKAKLLGAITGNKVPKIAPVGIENDQIVAEAYNKMLDENRVNVDSGEFKQNLKTEFKGKLSQQQMDQLGSLQENEMSKDSR